MELARASPAAQAAESHSFASQDVQSDSIGELLGPRRSGSHFHGRATCTKGGQHVFVVRWLWALHAGIAGGTFIEGELPVQERNFALFVQKFCYDFVPDDMHPVGIMELNITKIEDIPREIADKGQLYLMAFDDEQGHWKSIQRHWQSASCEVRKQMSSLYKMIDLNKGSVGNPVTYRLRIREHVRPRFWYFVIVACDKELVAPIRYKAIFLNELWGWQKEFSFDRMGMYRAFQIASVGFMLALTYTTYLTRSHDFRDHPYVKLVNFSYQASAAYVVLFFVHYWLFQQDGFGNVRLRFLGILASIVANCTVFLIGMLCSIGWAITCATMPHRRAFLGAVGVVGGLSAICELRAQETFDESTRLYSYQSVPGVFALIIKVFMFCWFAFHIRETIEEERDDKRHRFYKIMAVAFTIWFLNVPVTVLLAYMVAPWYRYKVVTIVDLTMRFCSQALLTYVFVGRFSPITEENAYPMRELSGYESGNGFTPMSDSFS